MTENNNEHLLNPHVSVDDGNDELSEKSKPKTKGLNQKPKIIILVGVVLFILFLIWASSHTGLKNMSNKGQSKSSQESSGAIVEQLVFNVPDGIIAADAIPNEIQPELPKEQIKPDHKKTDVALQIPISSYKDGPPLPSVKSENELMVLRLKGQLFEQGLLGKTSVNSQELEKLKLDSLNKRTVIGSPLSTQQDQVLQRLDAARQNLTALTNAANDTNSQYLQRLNAMRSSENASTFGGDRLVDTQNRQTAALNAGGDRWLLEAGGQAQAPRSLCEVRAGTVIPAIMISGINSDLPGQIISQVTQDVYDTATGRYMVIPQGSKLIGSYNNETSFGQERVLMAWQRIIFPDGRALDLGNMPGADQDGYAGLKDIVHTHFWRSMGAAFMMSLVIAGVEMSQNNYTNDRGSNTQNAGSSLSEALGQTMGQTMAQFIQRYMNLQPTIIIRPGNLLNVMVTKDIPFTKPYQAFNY